MLLELAVKASIPLVCVETDDPLNISLILSESLGVKVQKVPSVKTPNGSSYAFDQVEQDGVYAVRKAAWDKIDWEKIYGQLAAKSATAILVNPTIERPEFFGTGFVNCPESLCRKFVAKHSDAEPDSEDFEALVSALAGLSYQSMVRVTLLAQANSGVFSPRAIREVRRIFFGEVRGLRQENTEVPFYAPSSELTKWLKLDGKLFSENAPKALRARGLLLDGPPGTGKTMGAKFIARAMGLPLYRLDISATMNKYVGESEKGLEAALAQADRCAPCVMLIDEVEKLFGQHGDGGVTTRALSQLLWWLQEHQSRVLTVMTTNHKSKLPPELIRPGRIDQSFFLDELQDDDGLLFLQALAGHYKDIAPLDKKAIETIHSKLYAAPDAKNSHARLSETLLGAVKQQYLSANSKE